MLSLSNLWSLLGQYSGFRNVSNFNRSKVFDPLKRAAIPCGGGAYQPSPYKSALACICLENAEANSLSERLSSPLSISQMAFAAQFLVFSQIRIVPKIVSSSFNVNLAERFAHFYARHLRSGVQSMLSDAQTLESMGQVKRFGIQR